MQTSVPSSDLDSFARNSLSGIGPVGAATNWEALSNPSELDYVSCSAIVGPPDIGFDGGGVIHCGMQELIDPAVNNDFVFSCTAKWAGEASISTFINVDLQVYDSNEEEWVLITTFRNDDFSIGSTFVTINQTLTTDQVDLFREFNGFSLSRVELSLDISYDFFGASTSAQWSYVALTCPGGDEPTKLTITGDITAEIDISSSEIILNLITIVGDLSLSISPNASIVTESLFIIGDINLLIDSDADMADGIVITGSLSLTITESATEVLSADISGIYELTTTLRHDELYTRTGFSIFVETEDVKIPDIFVKSAYLGQ